MHVLLGPLGIYTAAAQGTLQLYSRQNASSGEKITYIRGLFPVSGKTGVSVMGYVGKIDRNGFPCLLERTEITRFMHGAFKEACGKHNYFFLCNPLFVCKVASKLRQK
jgi:hypothetical protein